MLRYADDGAVFLLNSPFPPDKVWDELPRQVQKQIIDKKLKFYVIDGYQVAKDTGMGSRINTIMQTCFFAISGVLPKEEAIEAIKHSIEKTYGKRGESIVAKNFAAVDAALAHLHEVKVPAKVTSSKDVRPAVPAAAPDFVKNVLAPMILGNGDDLPVSALPVDGTFPTGTAQWEKRNIALEIPEWDEKLCIQCGKCVLVCPHAVIRAKVYDSALLKDAPPTFKSKDAAVEELCRPEVHAAGGAGGLHRLRALHRGLPGEVQDRTQASRHQHGSADSPARAGSPQLGLLPRSAGDQPRRPQPGPGKGRAAAAAAL